jgi:hypothetical protein
VELEKKESFGTKKKTQSKKEKMIIDVNAILLVEKKKKGKLVVTTNKEIIEPSSAQEGNFGEVAKTSSILSEIGEKSVEIPSKKMAKHLAPIVEEVETQLIEK